MIVLAKVSKGITDSVCFALLIITMLGASSAQTFSSIDFPGATLTIAYGINKASDIVGTYNDASGVTHGFLLSAGTFTTIDYPGATLSVAAGINDAGLIVGQINDTAGHGHGFTWLNGKVTRLPDFGKVFDTAPVSVSNKGQIVGFTNDSRGLQWNGFEFTQQKYTTLDFPGAKFSVVLGISSRGANIVGTYDLNYPTGTFLGFLDVSGTFTTIHVPGSTSTQAFGVNDAGYVVGDYFVSGSSDSHGFLRGSGGFVTIDFPGATQTYPSNLNNFGEVVGWYIDSGNVTHGYLMTK